PDALDVIALVGIERLVVAREADLVARVELADDMRAGGETGLAQHLHHLAAVARADLDDGAELLVVERRQRELARAAGELLRRVALERIDVVRRRVERQRIEVDGDAAVPGESHLAHRREESTVGAVVVSED